MRTVENSRDRTVLAQDAGLPRVSFISALAGTMVAYGTSIVLVALAAGIAARVSDTETSTLTSYDWQRIGGGAAAVLALALLVAYLFGGYVAGRMARRAGMLNGFLVFVLGIAVIGGVAAAIGANTDQGTIVDGLRRAGIPTTGSEWRDIGTIAGIASLAAMLIGSIVGGLAGERWHGKLLTRALDPDIGPEANARVVEEVSRARRERVEQSTYRSRPLVAGQSRDRSMRTRDSRTRDDVVDDDAAYDAADYDDDYDPMTGEVVDERPAEKPRARLRNVRRLEEGDRRAGRRRR
jgi:hypothetical protein